ncbi:hypothetical protein [Flavobacterium sp. '19STA2R22 D10 B1']|uniref:hypothetical protein n=1 Tax=Flavobacterium aerium TaxID=3037261 RepID=UPI00278BFA4C|nr:hypothetical protein [Flavobacterium sp. '19STA2R22 D10 B1']
MTSTRKITGLLLLAFSIFFTANVKAQDYEKGFRLGFGANVGATTSDDFSVGLGIDGRVQYDLTKKMSLIGTTGYTHLFGKKDTPDLGFIPAKVGFKTFFGDRFYGFGEVGAGIGVTNTNQTTFLWAPGLGFATKYIDISVRYEDYGKFDAGQVALRLAYGFKL